LILKIDFLASIFAKLCKTDEINRMIALSVITLSGFQASK
jgi:hypothetical protein